MKNIFLITCLLSLSLLAKAQRHKEVVDSDIHKEPPRFTLSDGIMDNDIHKIVIQFSAGDSLEQVSIIGQVGNIRSAWPNSQIEVVCHSSGLDLLTSGKSKMAKSVADLSSQGVVFAACNNTMRRRNLKVEDLLPVSVVVPSAMVELVIKQEKGWAYLKGAH